MEPIPHCPLIRGKPSLHDPNRAGCILAGALLMCLTAWLAGPDRWRRGWRELLWFCLTLGVGVALLLTYSRGAMAAAVAGMGVLAWGRPRLTRRMAGALLLVGAIWLLVLIGAKVGTRWGEIGQGDRSAWNRVALWQAFPRMVAEAPGGWGVGQAGSAYRHFYQEFGGKERYRTLVNTHATWLVERGWWGRLGYVLAWGGALYLVWPRREAAWSYGALAIVVAMAISCWFSSVGELGWVWVMPGLVVVGIVIHRVRVSCWPDSRVAAGLLGAGVIGLGILWVCGRQCPSMPLVWKEPGIVRLGNEPVRWWVVMPREKFFQQPFGQMFRQLLREEPEQGGVALVNRLSAIPAGAGGTVLLCGHVPEWGGLDRTEDEQAQARGRLNGMSRIIWLNPLELGTRVDDPTITIERKMASAPISLEQLRKLGKGVE